jgi:hypothetical protein
MYRFAIYAIFVALCLASSSVFAGDAAGTQVCVGALGGAGGGVSGKVARDTFIKSLNKQKKPPLTSVPLESSLSDDVLAEAKQKTCEYVVITDLVEEHTESSYVTSMSGAQGNVPNFFVTTNYKVKKVSDGSEVASGSLKAQDTGSPQNAVDYTMNKMAAKVDGAIKGAK